ncbi:AraC-like DNA-binding protein [Chitinophaga polysaccharea]|uniref:AraC-like DNA-binding protein n=1 Tax=Chitinophaga polysaccharea TaxID=1293035 RepID=A0A561PTG4_9BACT|nr:AraC family transcriptional regulator [Chitinophaga polysaccharea]TWF41395.1 AraC-like DNA-binding protein [Chitinophaga polysaccharea]
MQRYMQVPPSIALSGFIKHYLFLETTTEAVKQLRLFADGHTGWVFSFKDRLIRGFTPDGTPAYLPDSFVYGQVNAFRDLYGHGHISLMIVVFHAHAVYSLLGIPSGELKDDILPTAELFGSAAGTLYDRLLEQPDISEKIRMVEDFFGTWLSGKSFPVQSPVTAAMRFIATSKGLVTVQQLTQLTGCHERKLERAFTAGIGVSPKQFAGIVKLHVFLRCLKTSPSSTHLTSLAYDAGYADQPHLIREFKKYTGLTPSQYRHQVHPLAVNFLAFRSPGV